MRRARQTVEMAGRIATAEALWYDTRRWPSFIDGLARVVKLEGDWPAAGATVIWDSLPSGRGRVVERVAAYEPRVGQSSQVEDERLRGTQTVNFEALEDGIAVTLTLEYGLKQGGAFRAFADVLFIRRAVGESLRRTLVRFSRELAAEDDVLL